jgi:uncharacterized membrane protein
MKKYFITGLAVLLPLTLTLFIVVFVFNRLTDPFAGITKEILKQNHFLEKTPPQLQHLISQVIIVTLIFFSTVFVGMIGRWLIVRYILRFTEKILRRIPFIRSVYNTCKDVIKTLFISEGKSFKQVVMVPYPNATTYCIGLLTRENMVGLGSHSDEELVAIFVPCTPNPTSGFLMMFRKNELIYLDMSVEEAFKYIISCGVISVSFNPLLPSANMLSASPSVPL